MGNPGGSLGSLPHIQRPKSAGRSSDNGKFNRRPAETERARGRRRPRQRAGPWGSHRLGRELFCWGRVCSSQRETPPAKPAASSACRAHDFAAIRSSVTPLPLLPRAKRPRYHAANRGNFRQPARCFCLSRVTRPACCCPGTRTITPDRVPVHPVNPARRSTCGAN